ncbi:hypothetical protein M1N80_02040 [Peptococcaceae bacterium]|nr:hypothetical protein [Peptococcaceae bacterium]
MSGDKLLDSFLFDEKTYLPSEEFVKQANVKDARIYQDASEDWLGYWEKEAEKLDWFEKWAYDDIINKKR